MPTTNEQADSAEQGQATSGRIYDPNRRQHYRFTRDAERLIIDIEIQPGGDGPLHIHPSQEERWTVLDGRLRFRVGHRRIVPQTGEQIVIAAGVKHAFKNIGDSVAHARAEVDPALELQGFLQDGAALARAGYYTRRGVVKSPKGLLEMARFLERYRDVAIICNPPRFAQRALIAVVSLFGGI